MVIYSGCAAQELVILGGVGERERAVRPSGRRTSMYWPARNWRRSPSAGRLGKALPRRKTRHGRVRIGTRFRESILGLHLPTSARDSTVFQSERGPAAEMAYAPAT